MTLFTPLTLTHPNHYFINAKVPFGQGFKVTPTLQEMQKIITFAWEMTFGKIGEHRHTRSGGTLTRENKAIFQDIVIGKLGELTFYRYCMGYVDSISALDLACYALGKWDKSDFEVKFNGRAYHFSIKTTKHFGNLLLLETKDWQVQDNRAIYIPNQQEPCYDFMVLCRVQSNFATLLTSNPLDNHEMSSQAFLMNLIKKCQVICDITGYISNQDLVHIIEYPYLLPQGAWLNGKIRMDASNYYVQSGCLRPLKHQSR